MIWVSRVVDIVPSSDRKVTNKGRDSFDDERLELLLRLRVRSVEGTSRKLEEVDDVDDDAEWMVDKVCVEDDEPDLGL